MDCIKIFHEKNYSFFMLNKAFNDDSGSWWWWTNIIGTLIFGLIGLIGNIICFIIVYRYSASKHSFVVYFCSLSLFDFLTLFYEFIQSLNDLLVYLFEINFLNFRLSIFCKLSDYLKYSVILLSCWTIVALTIDRFILVCHPFKKNYPNLSKKLCNANIAKRIMLILILFSLLINIPQLIYKEWICRPAGFQYSAVYYQKSYLNQTEKILTKQICSCRVSPLIKASKIKFFVFWNNYIFHLLFYTFIPAIILITSNTAILIRINARRQIISTKNEYLRSKLTCILTLVSFLFLLLYFPYAIVQTLSYFLIRNYQSHCNIDLILKFHILKRLTELLNIIALGINFFFYILCLDHYRSSAIQLLHLNHFNMFKNYVPIQLKTIKTTNRSTNHQEYIQTNHSNMKLLKVTTSHDAYSTSSIFNHRLSRQLT